MFLPGEPSAHSTLPVFLSMAMKLGAAVLGMLIWLSSTPLDVQTKSRLSATVTEQLHILCWETPCSAIMSKLQITSASSLVVCVSDLNGPSFSPLSWKPFVSRQRTSPRLVTNQRRSPSTSGEQQMPCRGQSWTRPVGSFSLECCQRKEPSDS